MEKIEQTSRRKAKKGEIQKIVLESVKSAGLLGISFVAPNVIKSMRELGIITYDRQGEAIKSSASKLLKKGLIEFNGNYYKLTSAGERELKHLELTNFEIPQPKSWDHKWRVIIFDIPEKKRKIRSRIRNIFVSAGFYRLQDSVWVYPYDCEDIIGLLKTDLGVGKDILYMIVDEIENDRKLRDEFSLT